MTRKIAALTLLFAIGIPSAGLPIEPIGSSTIAWLRQGNESNIVGVATGMLIGAVSMGLTCKQAFTVGELQAYLQYTAEPSKTLVEALREYLTSRGCHLAGDSQGAAPWIEALYFVRTSDNVEFLRNMATGTPTGKYLGAIQSSFYYPLLQLLAKDRLRELGQPVGRTPPQ